MSDATCVIKNRASEDMTKRREYGMPGRVGLHTYDDDGNIIEYNTMRSDFCKYTRFNENNQKALFNMSISNGPDTLYVAFLQDYFYRKYKGYLLPYFELPLGNSKRMELYNQTALDCGHPEYMVDDDGAPIKIQMAGNIEDKSEKEESKDAEDTNAGTVDVVDSEGNVVAENVGYASENAKKESTKAEPAKQDDDEDPDEGPKDTKNANAELQPAVFFTEIGPNGLPYHVTGDRAVKFRANHEAFVKSYPELQRFLDMYVGSNELVEFENLHGLVKANVYDEGVPEPKCAIAIDPAKIRNHYSVIASNVNGAFAPFDSPLIGFNHPYFNRVAHGDYDAIIDGVVRAATNVNLPFFKYIAYNAIPNNDIALVAANTHSLCAAMYQLGLNIRFKITRYENAGDFSMEIVKGVGLAKFTNNNQYLGLRIDVSTINAGGSNKVIIAINGNRAEEITNAIRPIMEKIESMTNNTTSLAEAVEPYQEDKQKKASNKTGKIIEKPVGRK